jgi:hypothetical protein
VVKASSVVRALRYFEGMPEEIQRLLPAEWPAGRRWAKLKRGRLRILVRSEEAGRGQFHLFPRSEWTHPMETL